MMKQTLQQCSEMQRVMQDTATSHMFKSKVPRPCSREQLQAGHRRHSSSQTLTLGLD